MGLMGKLRLGYFSTVKRMGMRGSLEVGNLKHINALDAFGNDFYCQRSFGVASLIHLEMLSLGHRTNRRPIEHGILYQFFRTEV